MKKSVVKIISVVSFCILCVGISLQARRRSFRRYHRTKPRFFITYHRPYYYQPLHPLGGLTYLLTQTATNTTIHNLIKEVNNNRNQINQLTNTINNQEERIRSLENQVANLLKK